LDIRYAALLAQGGNTAKPNVFMGIIGVGYYQLNLNPGIQKSCDAANTHIMVSKNKRPNWCLGCIQ
jgi:hypothetical protein